VDGPNEHGMNTLFKPYSRQINFNSLLANVSFISSLKIVSESSNNVLTELLFCNINITPSQVTDSNQTAIFVGMVDSGRDTEQTGRLNVIFGSCTELIQLLGENCNICCV
jgi:hypothetical protein